MAIEAHNCRFMAVDAELVEAAIEGGVAVHCLIAVWVCEHPRRQRTKPGPTGAPICVADVLGECSLFGKVKCPKRERLTK